MTEIIKIIILGIVQGATEFIPVSSSGHLVIIPWILGWAREPEASLLVETVLHWGTLLAILIIFWRDFWQMIIAVFRSIATRSLTDRNARLGWFLVIGSIPAAILGLLFKDFVESLFASPVAAGGFLLVTGALLLSSEWLSRNLQARRALSEIKWMDSIIIGCAQALALAPGISRSGTTIAAGLICGIRREDAARFSFLLGTPVFFGAGLLQILDALAVDSTQITEQWLILAIGFVVSAITGFIAIRFLLNYLRDNTLYPFAIYCFVVGLSVIGLGTFVW